MSQQIINIPVNWDDDLFNKVIEKGVVNEVKDQITKKSLEKLGLKSHYGTSNLFDRVLKECIKEMLDENKDVIIEEIIKRSHKSLISSKGYKQAKEDLLKGESND